jgi:hypothetical protein
VDVRIDSTCRQDSSFSGQNLRGSSNFHAGRDTVHDSGISRLAYARDEPITDCEVRLVDPRIVQNQSVRDHKVGGASSARCLRGLPHPVANDLTASELAFIAIDSAIRFHFYDQIGVSKADAISGRRVNTNALVIGKRDSKTCCVRLIRVFRGKTR